MVWVSEAKERKGEEQMRVRREEERVTRVGGEGEARPESAF
jgi:hypothetical protein